MKFKYSKRSKWMRTYADEYYSKEIDSIIMVTGIGELYKLDLKNNNRLYDSDMFEYIKVNEKESYFKIKDVKFSYENKTAYYIMFKVNANGDMFDIKVEIPNIFKCKLNLEGYNIYDLNYCKIMGKIDKIIDGLNIGTKGNEKILKKEMKKYENNEC